MFGFRLISQNEVKLGSRVTKRLKGQVGAWIVQFLGSAPSCRTKIFIAILNHIVF